MDEPHSSLASLLQCPSRHRNFPKYRGARRHTIRDTIKKKNHFSLYYILNRSIFQVGLIQSSSWMDLLSPTPQDPTKCIPNSVIITVVIFYIS